MDAQTCILTRRSIRKFTAETVSHAEIEKIVSLASYAPSWKNTQISHYIAIEDQSLKQEISQRFCPSGSNNAVVAASCPVLIVQVFTKNQSGFNRDGSFTTDREDGWQYFDCGIAAQTFCLAAHDLGLSTLIMGAFDRKGLQAYLNIPEDQEIMSLIALGHAAADPSAPQRKGVETLLSYR